MDLLKSLIIGIIILIVTIFIIKRKKQLEKKLMILIVGIVIAVTALVFPLYKENSFISQLIFSLLYGIKTILLGQDYEIIGKIELNNFINIIYVCIMYLLFLLGPLTTATTILAIIGNRIAKIKILFCKSKPAVVFSEINEKTVTIAKQEYNKNKPLIIFTDENKKEVNDIKSITIEQNISNTNLKNKDLTYYLFSNNEEQNLIDALEIIRKNKEKKNVKVYVLNNTEEARIILDSCDKGNIKLEIVNEIDRVIYNLLDKYPIYENCIDNDISILIVGCGKIGTEFLKSATWCGQILNHSLNINVIDVKANEIKEKLEITCPDLIKNYNYNFINGDIYSKKVIQELAKLKNINYILVSMDTDKKNLETAILLRRYFLKNDTNSYTRMPIINLWIQNNDKKIQVDNLKYGKDIDLYHLNTFGSIKEMYEEETIINSEIEKMAKQVHSIYDPEDKNNGLKRFYETEYNKKSSRAVAVHLKYKLYSILKDKYNGDLEYDLQNNIDKVLQQYDLIKDNKDVKQSLIENEHERWNAYTRTDGFEVIDAKEVEKYIKFTGNTKHFLAKFHPALVPFDKLRNVEETLNKDFTKSDINIIENIEGILKKDIYKD